ncbi:MAG: VOC family protein [Planctomycetes bacterium]|nr:VOC family protein [Planctomycetota bacterium]
MPAEYKPGSVVHLEIPAPDMKKALKFYKTVFGWEVEGDPKSPYCMFKDGHVGGGFDGTAKPTKKGNVLIVFTPDITTKLKEIKKAGGKSLQKKTKIEGGHGYCAYFKDPNGNKLGLWSPPEGK